jgi:penicillin-insensitive murein endopeptidase
VESPGFIRVGRDGLAWDDRGKRFLRFDVERTWLLIKALMEDPEGRVQWVFVNTNVEALLVEWARARGESGETILRAMEVMLEPHPGGAHDDHVHVRTACSPAELVAGCEHTGPRRAWLDVDPLEAQAANAVSDEELLDAIFRPFGSWHPSERTARVSPPPPPAASP